MFEWIKQIYIVAILFSMFLSAPARANYDKKCFQLLTKTPEQVEAFEDWKQNWDGVFYSAIGINRPATEVEYEAMMDITHDLALTAAFEGGEKVSLRKDHESIKKLELLLIKSELIEAIYSQDSLAKLGDLYKKACVILERNGCEVYDRYRGLKDTEPRPFSPLEELIIKWCTFHMASDRAMAAKMVSLRNTGQASERQIDAIHARAESEITRTAKGIFSVTFIPQEADFLFTQLIQPYISASFARTYDLYKGKRMQ
jgi:hypothetical protein